MQPTPLAQQLADPVAMALRHVTQALNRPEAFCAAVSQRQFMLAMSDVGEVYFMPTLIDKCRQCAPGIQICAVRAGVDLKTQMESGRIDLAIGAFANISGPFYQRRLFRQMYVSMFRRGHPLADKKITLKQFLAAQHLMVAARDSPYDRINQSLEKAGVCANMQFSVPHFMAAPYIVSSTDLLVTVPQKLAASAALPFKLQYVRPPLRLPSLQTNIFWHRRFHQDEGNQWLRGVIAEQFAE